MKCLNVILNGFDKLTLNSVKDLIIIDGRFRVKPGMTANNFGFTLVELLIVVSMIGIITSGVFTLLDPLGQIRKGRDAKRKSDLSQIQRALETYYQDNGKYPLNTNCSYQPQGDNGDGNSCIEWGSSWLPFMPKTPKEDDPSRRYVYIVSSDQQKYYLYTSLQRGAKDPQVCNNGNECTNVGGVSCGAAGTSAKICNFGVSSPNTSP